MIRDLTESLKSILTQAGLPAELAAAQISFERPAEPFSPTTPTVNLFLFDIRENLELRLNEPSVVRSNGTAKISQPPRRILCTYLITTWVNSGIDTVLQEHRLLSQVLARFSRFPIIPKNLAIGAIKTSDPPVQLQVAVGGAVPGISEFWSALGAKLRPSLTLQATIAMPVYQDNTELLVITSKIAMIPLQSGGTTSSFEAIYQIAGRVTKSTGELVANAIVTLVEANLQSKTDADGVYRFGPLVQGQYTIQATTGAENGQIQCQVPTPKNTDYSLQVS